MTSVNTIVLGLGDTGLSCVRHLRARGATVTVNDSRTAPPHLDTVRAEFPEVTVHTGAFNEKLYADADTIILSPGINPADAGVDTDAANVIGDIELFARAIATRSGAITVAITGSNGKSTVTALTAAICKHAGINAVAGGNLGPPALDLLATDSDVFVLELSSFQLQTSVSLKASAAAVLNVSADHADRHPDAEAYAAIKQRVYHNAATAIVNRDDATVRAMKVNAPTVTFGSLPPPAADDYGITRKGDAAYLARGDVLLVDVAAMQLRGAHNHCNALAAMALAEAAGVAPAAMPDAVTAFRGLAHRYNLIATDANGITWVNDSKATNPAAAAAALNSTSRGRTVWIAGGDGKDADFTALAAAARRAHTVITIGRDGARIANAVDAATVIATDTVTNAVARAASVAKAGDTVLFSPACASFDQYANFRARGDDFCAAVARLTEAQT